MSALESLNPFFDSELAPAMGDPGSATAPDLSDPPVAVAVNSGMLRSERSVALTEDRKSHGDRNPMDGALVTAGETAPNSISVSAVPAEGVVPAGETPAPIAPVLVGTSDSELAGVSCDAVSTSLLGTLGKKDQASNPQLAEGPVVAPRQTESFAARSLGPGRKKDQAFNFVSDGVFAALCRLHGESEPSVTLASPPSDPPIGPRSLPTGPTPAADALLSLGSAAFSLDLRIHNIMLAVADELADEQRTINERLLLQQFAPQLRLT